MTTLPGIIVGELSATVSREALREGVRAVAGAISKRTTLEVMGSFRLVAENGRLTITASDFDHWVTRVIPAEIEDEGVVLLSADALLRLVDGLPPEPVHITPVRGKGRRVRLQCGNVKSVFSCLPSDEYPNNPVDTSDAVSAGWLPLSQILSLAQRTSYSTSNAQSRPILHGVLCQLRSDRLRMVATSGVSCAIAESPVTGVTVPNGKPQLDAIVFPKTFEHAARCLAGEGDVEVSIGYRAIRIRGDAGEVSSRLIEGPFPQIDNVIPRESTRSIVVNREALLATIKRMVFTEGEFARVEFDATADGLTVESQDVDKGEITDSVPARLLGDPIRFAASSRLVYAALDHLPTDDVRFELTEPHRAIMIRPENWSEPGDVSALVMPLRIQ